MLIRLGARSHSFSKFLLSKRVVQSALNIAAGCDEGVGRKEECMREERKEEEEKKEAEV